MEKASCSNVNMEKEENMENGTNSTTPGDELREYFSDVPCNLNVVHINCQSIPAHYMQMLSAFGNSAIDAVLVSETFLKTEIDSKKVDLPGYTLIRNDRLGKGSGGVAIYLREHLTYTVIDRSPENSIPSPEYLLIEVLHENTKVLLGVFYNPSSKIKYFPVFQSLLRKYRKSYEHVIIQGDFNTDLLKKNRYSQKLLSIVDEENMSLLMTGPTHTAPHCAASEIDLMMVSSLSNVARARQLIGCFSYHSMLCLSYKLNFKNVPIAAPAEVEGDDKPFWSSPIIRETLALQLAAMKKYKSTQSDSDLKDYQKFRDIVTNLETEFKRKKRNCQKLQKSVLCSHIVL